MSTWTSQDMPSQTGRTAVVTGTGGLGFQTALALAGAGAEVIMAGRNTDKGAAAVQAIRQLFPNASVAFRHLDLASLESIRTFAIRLRGALGCLDMLVNNAAVMTPPQKLTTAEGYELQLGTNYLGHFALTAHLLPLLIRSGRSRVVTLSSVAARGARIDFDDLQSDHRYQPMAAYGQSKLACLMFALEMQALSDELGWGVKSMAAHPGIARTDLLTNGAGPWSAPGLARRLAWFLFQPAPQGALPTLFAATSPHAQGGSYVGPDKFGETRGHPTSARVPELALDTAIRQRLWTESERLTNTFYPRGKLEAAGLTRSWLAHCLVEGQARQKSTNALMAADR
jgi:NAD(P)-dependent dehydrogenase (short-subunit alcohol dehydrogenase family)